MVTLDHELGELGFSDHNPEAAPATPTGVKQQAASPRKTSPSMGNFNCRQCGIIIVVAHPVIAANLNRRFSAMANLGMAAFVILIGLAALTPAWPVFGIFPAMLIMTMMGFIGFTISRTLHAESDSSKRATVLSVKGLAFNFGYGVFSLAFSRLLAGFPDQPAGMALRNALRWQVPFFALMMLLLFSWASSTRGGRTRHLTP